MQQFGVVYLFIHQNRIITICHFFNRSTEALMLWNKRCTPMLVHKNHYLSIFLILISSAQIVLLRALSSALQIFWAFHWVIWSEWKTLTNGSVIHMWLSVLCLYFSLLFCLHLNETKTQGLFSWLLQEKYLGKPENSAVGHSILATAVRRPRKIWWAIQNQG